MEFNLNRQYNPKVLLSKINFDNELFTNILFKLLLFIFFLFFIFSIVFDNTQDSKVRENISDIGSEEYALIIASEIPQGGDDLVFLEDRVDMAIELYKQNKIQRIILAGDSRFQNYDLISKTKDMLEKEKVPDFILLVVDEVDSIYDSCSKIKSENKINKAVIISQEYQLSRSLYTCNSLGIESIGIAADKSIYGNTTFLQIAEFFRKLGAVIDVVVIRP